MIVKLPSLFTFLVGLYILKTGKMSARNIVYAFRFFCLVRVIMVLLLGLYTLYSNTIKKQDALLGTCSIDVYLNLRNRRPKVYTHDTFLLFHRRPLRDPTTGQVLRTMDAYGHN